MNGAVLFFSAIVTVVIFLGFRAIKDWQAFRDHPKLKNVLGGILSVIAIALIWATLGNKANADEANGTWFNYLEMFVGIDYDKDSLFCRNPAPMIVSDDRWTSNVGFIGNVYRSGDRAFEAGLKYQHHSCAFNQDRPTYDSVGFVFTYRIGD